MTTSRGVFRPLGVIQTCKQTAQVTNNATATPTDVTGMAFSVLANRRYYVKFVCVYRTAATTTGVGFSCSGPALTGSYWTCQIQQGGTGTDQMFEQSNVITSSLVSASVVAQDTDYIATLEGYFEPSANGTLQLRCRTEVDSSLITVQNTGIGFLIDAG